MKATIITSVITFIVCLMIYGIANDVIDNKKQSAYQKGYLDGYSKKSLIESDSLDRELTKHRDTLDSLFNAIKSIR